MLTFAPVEVTTIVHLNVARANANSRHTDQNITGSLPTLSVRGIPEVSWHSNVRVSGRVYPAQVGSHRVRAPPVPTCSGKPWGNSGVFLWGFAHRTPQRLV